MTILVTGGAGFIGTHLVRTLLASGETVRVLDEAIGTPKAAALNALAKSHPNKLSLLQGNVATPVTAGRASEGVTIVYHLAAQASVSRSVVAPLETLRTNATGTAVMAEAARTAGVKRFVLASTCAVYPGSESPVSESHPPHPASPYAASKLAAEAWLMAATESLGLSAVVVRLFNVIGAGQSADSLYGAVVPRFVDAIKRGVPATILGDGGQTRDFVHVSDAVAALLAAGGVKVAPVGPMNVGSGQAVSILDLHRTLTEIAREHGITAAKPIFGPARPGEVRHSTADVSRAAVVLGWRPVMGLHEGLRRVWRGE